MENLTPNPTIPKYVRFAILGIASLCILFVLLNIIFDNFLLFGNTAGSDSVLHNELILASAIADRHFKNKGSYSGICESIKPIITTADSFTCNESGEAWAVAVSKSEETLCADSNGYSDAFHTDLNDNLVCSAP